MKKLILCLGLLSIFACHTKTEREILEEKLNGLNVRVMAIRNSVQERADFLEKISKLSEEKKVQYHYDSISKVQLEETSEFVRINDSLQILKQQLNKSALQNRRLV